MQWDEKVLEALVLSLGVHAVPCASAVGSVSIISLHVLATRADIFPELCCVKCPVDEPDRVVGLNMLSLCGRGS